MNKIDEYVKTNFRTKSTQYQYKSNLKLFFDFLDVNPENYFDKDSKRDYEKDIKAYWSFLMTAKQIDKETGETIDKARYAPKSIPVTISIIKNYFEENDVVLNPRIFKKFAKRGKGIHTIREDRIPKLEEIKTILSHGEIRDRAIFLMMITSGIREKELTRLKISNVDFDSEPTKITIPATIAKNRTRRVTFLTPEATDALLLWLKARSRHIERNQKRFTGLKNYLEEKFEKEIKVDASNRIFPVNTGRMRERWNLLLQRAGLTEKDQATGDYVLHLYVLRKYFNTRLQKSISQHIVELLMGHVGYLNGSYDRFTDEELAQYYEQGMHQLYIFMQEENQERTENIKMQMEKLQSQVEELMKQSRWYKESIISPDDGKPIMSDKGAVLEYQKQKKTIKEIKEDGLELWGMRQRGKARMKKDDEK